MMKWTLGRIIIAAAGAVVILTCIIFAIPFITVPYNVEETYTDTIIKQEPYVATEPYISLEIQQKEEIIYHGTPYSVPHGVSIPFSVSKDDSRLLGSFNLPATGGFYLYSSAGQILYEQLGAQGNVDIPLREGNYTVTIRERVMWGGQMSIDIRLVYTAEEEVTAYREVTKYREVPVTEEKQRTRISYKKASIWEIIFVH